MFHRSSSNCVPLMWAVLQRGEKFARKHKIAMQEALGERLDEAVNLRLLATAPDKQGRGYASALVRIVTGIVSHFTSFSPGMHEHLAEG